MASWVPRPVRDKWFGWEVSGNNNSGGSGGSVKVFLV